MSELSSTTLRPLRSLSLGSAGLAAAALVLLSGCINTGDFTLSPFRRADALSEAVIYGKDNAGPKLALVEVKGVIDEDSSEDLLSRPGVSMVSRVREALDMAREDDEVKGLLLRIESPGGTVTASETIHHELQRFRERTGRPIVAYMNGMAASGGYYVAMAADEIVAHPTSITGSIGVVAPSVNIAGLMERFGVVDQTLTTGRFKDSGSIFRPMREDERAYLEAILEELFVSFRSVVRQGRPKLTPEQIDALADGRVFTASQAQASGLVDTLGHFEAAVAALEARAGVRDTRVVMYQRPSAYRTNIYSRSTEELVGGESGGLSALIPRAGFYYIWPPALLELGRAR